MNNDNNENNNSIKAKRPLSEETKRKISEAAKARGPTGKPSATRNRHVLINGVLSKKCGTCKETKPLITYGKFNGRWDGLNSRCLICHNQSGNEYKDARPALKKAANEKRVKDAREVKFQAVKLAGGKCHLCGYALIEGENESVFDFHHLDPVTKKFRISSKNTTNLESLREEIEKCVLLCKNCHRMQHGR